MRSKIHARLSAFAFSALACLFAAAPARAQEEGVPKVVDEVIAQVNNEVITLSMLRQEMKDAAQGLAEQKKIPLAQAQEEVAKRQAEIIATLINEQLLLQKGKELGFADNVEKEVNERMVAVMKQENLRTLEQLEQAMRESGVDPAAVRQSLRAEIMKQAVLQQEVNYKLYWGLTDSEIKNYYAAHKDKFRKPESVALSEIFLSTAGKDDAEVRARAQQIVAQLRGGADFATTAKAVSEREDQNRERVAQKTGGKLGTFAIDDISNPELQAAVKALKVGGVTDPVKLPDGYIVIRVDERTPAGEPVYDENKVREAIATERLEQERKNYLAKLREESFVEVSPTYRDQVMPILGATANAAKPADATKPSTAKKNDKNAEKAYTNGNKKP
ncbi:MAG: peptidyl-prolyl cis-trans isomerase [Acidobacteria bacterium]|nr:peptidyl-prolyl cis-trans isomerase [Acidobacteriota bacterium]